MTIDEAIIDLRRFSKYCERVNWITHGKAVKLGIEALKRLLDERTCSSQWPLRPLTGETEE